MVADLTVASSLKQQSCIQAADEETLHTALEAMGGDPPAKIPFVVKLLENPSSPIALPGKIDLYRHDCLHLLLERGFSLRDEAFVVGFTMGSDRQTKGLHLALFKLCSRFLYPATYRFEPPHLQAFDLGVAYGRTLKIRDLNRFDFQAYAHQPLASLQQQLGIQTSALATLRAASADLTPD